MRAFNVNATAAAAPSTSSTARRVGFMATLSLVASMLFGLPASAAPEAPGTAVLQTVVAGSRLGPAPLHSTGSDVVGSRAAESAPAAVTVVERPLVISDLGYAELPEPHVATPSPAPRPATVVASAVPQAAARAARPTRSINAGRAGVDREGDRARSGSDRNGAAERSQWRRAASRDRADDMRAAYLPDTPAEPGAALSPETLAAALVRARADWAVAVGEVPSFSASIEDLPGATLGQSSGSAIVIDVDAAGWGWSRMDLLTVVRHEIGHALGREHTEAGLMASTLAPGEIRSVPAAPAVRIGEPAPATAPVPAAETATEEPVTSTPTEETVTSTPTEETVTSAPTEETVRSDVAAQAAPSPDADADPTTPSATTEDVEAAGAEGPRAPERVPEADVDAMSGEAEPAAAEPAPAELDAGSVSVPPVGPTDEVPATLSWIVTDGDATLDVGDSGGVSTVTYDAEHGVLRLNIADVTADLPVEGLVRVTIVSGNGTVTLTGEIRLTSTGLVVRARHVVVESGTTIDTRGALVDGAITLEAIAADDDVRAPNPVAGDSEQPRSAESATAEPVADVQPEPGESELHESESESERSDDAVEAAAGELVEDSPGLDAAELVLPEEPAGSQAVAAAPETTRPVATQPTAEASNALADASVTVTGARLMGGDITLVARSAANGAAEASSADVAVTSRATVGVIDSEIISSGAVTLLAESSAAASATASGEATHADAARDAAAASVRLVSTATSTLGGRSTVVADGVLSVLAKNSTDARSWGDASGATAGAGIATASVDRVTIAAIDGAGDGGITARRLDVSADSEGAISVRSAASTGGATQNDVPASERVISHASTPDSYVNVASALGEGRLNGQTHSYLASGSGRSLTVSTTEAQRVTARTTDVTDVAADGSAAGAGAAVAVALRTLEARADLEGDVVLIAPEVVLDAGLERTASLTSALGASTDAVAVEVARSVTEAGLLPGSTLDVGPQGATANGGAAVTFNASSTTRDLASAKRAALASEAGVPGVDGAPVGATRATVAADTITRSWIADGAVLLGASDLTLAASSNDSATADAGESDDNGSAQVLLTATTTSTVGSGPTLVLTGDLAVLADQVADATSLGADASVTLDLERAALVGRDVTVGGSLSLAVNGTPVATTPADAVLVLDGARAAVTWSVPAGLSSPGEAVVGTVPGTSSATPSEARFVAPDPLEAPDPTRGSVPVEGVVVSAGAVSAGGGAHRDGPAAPVPAFSALAAVVARRVRLFVPVALLGDLRQRSGRGPPRDESDPAGVTSVPGGSALLGASAVGTSAVGTSALQYDGLGASRSPVTRVGVLDASTSLSEADHPAQSQALQSPADSVQILRVAVGTVAVVLRALAGAGALAVVVCACAASRPADLIERGTAVTADSVVRGATIWGVGGAADSCALGWGGSRHRGVAAGGLGTRVGRGTGGPRRGAGAAVVSVGGQGPRRLLALSAAPSGGGPAAPQAREACLGRSGPAGSPSAGRRARCEGRARTWADVPNGSGGAGT